MVLSGHETAEDFEEAAKEFEEILAMKQEFNVGAMIQVNTTYLVCYPHTGCGYLKRNTTIMSLKKVRAMKQMIERFRGRIKFKFSSKEYSTFVEQMALDLGRIGTSIWQKAADEGYFYWGSSYGEGLARLIESEIVKRGLKFEEIFAERPKDWIFPIDMIENKSKEYLDLLHDSVGKRSLAPCIKTPVKNKNVCLNCGYCETKEEKKWTLTREISNEKNIQDLEEARFNNKPAKAYRIGFKVKEEYALVGKESLSHYIASRIIDKMDIVDKFHSVQNVSNSQILQGGIEDWMWGNFFFDLWLKSDELDKIEKFIDEHGEDFDSLRVFSVAEVEVGRRVATNTEVLYRVYYEGVGEHRAKILISSFDKKVKYGTRGLGTMYMVNTEEKDIDFPVGIMVKSAVGGIKMAFKIPINVHPSLFLSSIFKAPLKKVMKDSVIEVVSYMKDTRGFCKHCGNSKEFNILSRKEMPACSLCIGKALMK